MASVAAPVLLLFFAFCPLSTCNVLTRDVAIIGGGSSGTYAAIRLQSLGYSVALIEKEARLGGQVDTYVDPATGATFDNGVIAFDNIPVVTGYFKHLGIALSPLGESSNDKTVYANFAKKTLVKVTPMSNGTAATLLAYQAQLDKYPYLINGFNLPDPLPDDLLLPWGEFIRKYNLSDLAYTAHLYNQGIGNILAQPTLYIVKYLNAGEVHALLTGDSLTTTNHDNQALYNAAARKLGSSMMLTSNVTRVTRGTDGVEVEIARAGGRNIVRAQKLLLAIPPELPLLRPWLDLSNEEETLFGQFNNSYYWCGIVANSSIPDNTTLLNVDPDAPFAIPAMPELYSIGSTGISGLHSVYYSSAHFQSNSAVQAAMLQTISGLQKKVGSAAGRNKPEFVFFHNHSPFFLTVGTNAIRNGFYGRLEALQGQDNTFYTGAAWQTQDSSMIWNFTEYSLLPQLTRSLAGNGSGDGIAG